jgi:hypothetical protein
VTLGDIGKFSAEAFMRVFTLEELPELMILVDRRNKEKADAQTEEFGMMLRIPKNIIRDDPAYPRYSKKAKNRWER